MAQTQTIPEKLAAAHREAMAAVAYAAQTLVVAHDVAPGSPVEASMMDALTARVAEWKAAEAAYLHPTERQLRRPLDVTLALAERDL